MADSTLAAIITKVRRLTRSPSTAQLADDTIKEYVNTFYLYDVPEHLRVFDLKTTLSFYTQPNVDVYETTTSVTTDPLYNFKNKYITVNPPVYVAGFEIFYSQSREEFFNIYPKLASIASIGTTGNGVTTAFSGTLSSIPILRNNVLFDSIDSSNNGIALIDNPITNSTGTLIIPNDTSVSYGTINYVTGAYSITFPAAPGSGEVINSQTVPYVASRPQAILYFDDKFTVRPVPDQPYKIDIEVFIRPTELLTTGQGPLMEQWWQYLAYGATKKVFEDRMDQESIAAIMPEYKQQESLVLRKTVVQNTNQRAPSIYSQQTDGRSSFGGQWGSPW